MPTARLLDEDLNLYALDPPLTARRDGVPDAVAAHLVARLECGRVVLVAADASGTPSRCGVRLTSPSGCAAAAVRAAGYELV